MRCDKGWLPKSPLTYPIRSRCPACTHTLLHEVQGGDEAVSSRDLQWRGERQLGLDSPRGMGGEGELGEGGWGAA